MTSGSNTIEQLNLFGIATEPITDYTHERQQDLGEVTRIIVDGEGPFRKIVSFVSQLDQEPYSYVQDIRVGRDGTHLLEGDERLLDVTLAQEMVEMAHERGTLPAGINAVGAVNRYLKSS